MTEKKAMLGIALFLCALLKTTSEDSYAWRESFHPREFEALKNALMCAKWVTLQDGKELKLTPIGHDLALKLRKDFSAYPKAKRNREIALILAGY